MSGPVRRLAAATILTVLALTGSAGAAGAGSTPGRVLLRTTPALPGVHLLVGSTPVTTGADGTASVRVGNINGIASRVALTSHGLGRRHTLALAFVAPAPHTTKYVSRLTVGIDVTSQVRLRVDPGATAVARKSVHQVRLHAVTGTTRVVDPQRHPVVRLLSRKARRPGSSAPQAVTWTVDSLRSASGATVTTSRTPFDPFTGKKWRLELRPVAGTVEIDTVPATSGVTFVLDGNSFATDLRGHASAQVADLDGVDQRVRADPTTTAGLGVSVARVARQAPLQPFQRRLVVALAVSQPVLLRFTDPAGSQVPADRVSEVRLDSGGGTVRIDRSRLAEPVSLVSSVGKLVDGRWTPQPVTYAVKQVRVEGANAVFSGQQRIDPSVRRNWDVTVSVFDVRVTMRDVMFGRRLSSSVYVVRPDGTGATVELGAARAAVIPSLVRGEYTLTSASAVVGADSRILVSKATEVDLRVVTLLDVSVAGLLVLALTTGLVLGGQRLRRGAGRGATGARGSG